MYAVRFFPNVIRGVVSGSSELVTYTKCYNNQNAFQAANLQPFSSQSRRRSQILNLSLSTGSYNHQNITNQQSKLTNNFKTPNLNISTSQNNLISSLVHNENNHAWMIMQSLPAYTRSIVSEDQLEKLFTPIDISKCPPPLPNINWASVNLPSIIGSFVHLSKESRFNDSNLSSDKYFPIVSALVNNMMHLSNNQMKELLAALTFWNQIDNASSKNFSQLWNSIDNMCVKRVRSMSIEDTFIFGDLFFKLKLSRICTYTRAMLNVLGHKLTDMPPHYLVQYGFNLNLSRTNPGGVSHLNYERAIANAMVEISLEELGVIAMGLFKTQTFIQSDELCDAIFARLLGSDLTGTSSISIASILKVLRKSIKAHHADKVYALLNHIEPSLSDFSLLAQLQIALVGSDCLVFHPKVITGIATNFVEDTSSLRLKDIERMVLVLMIFNFIPSCQKNILAIFAQELRKPERISEINKFPKSFLSSITYMVTMGFMPEDLISTALQPSIVNTARSSVNYADIGREILELDYSVEVELPNYKGNKLNPKLRRILGNKYFSRFRLPKDVLPQDKKPLTHQERLLIEVENKLQVLLGNNEAVTSTYVLPHNTSPDIVFCTDLSGEPVSIPDSFHLCPRTDFKYPLNFRNSSMPIKWNAVVVGGRNNYIRGTTRVRGQTQMKIRQLQTLGYSVTLLPFMTFSKKNVRRKLEVLDNLLTENSILNPDPERVDEAFINLRAKQIMLNEN